MDQPVTPFDLHRMFIGAQPLLFYAEIGVRTLAVYAYTLLLIRWIGGRGVAQLSLVEFVLVIALGSAVGDAMFYPEVPLLAAMAVITIVVAINKALDLAILRWDRAKRALDGRPVTLIHNGRILHQGAAQRDLGMAEIRAMMRVNGIRNLGEVEHAFLEAGGGLSVFRRATPLPGLRLVPPMDVMPLDGMGGAAAAADSVPLAQNGQTCCCDCGAVAPAASWPVKQPCPHCGSLDRTAPQKPDPRSPDP